ncbi:L,D-transpeptidase [Nocardioides sp. C4-1]|uniref:L,D-transpeptidase n=1 Tax=Nocardioides sp. C4-1 TaxID=3151851 RepID=UPI00326436F1
MTTRQHRAEVAHRLQPRWGRFAVLGASLATTAIALLGGIGVLPSAADHERSRDADLSAAPVAPSGTTETTEQPQADELPQGEGSPDLEPPATEAEVDVDADAADAVPVVPADSGEGRRVVFSESEQRVWLVGSAGKVKRTYLVSGSLTDNLDPGTYQVYSRSENAIGIDDSGTMKWFVRFTQGPSGAAIGFHTIPVDDGERVQTNADLGTPQSHGCIRQKTTDAKALWAFAPLGSTVVVV